MLNQPESTRDTVIRVAATHAIGDELIASASDRLHVVKMDTAAWSEADFIENLRGFAGVLVNTRTPMNAKVLQALSADLRIISSYTAGVENIDLAAARRLGIAVTNTGSIVAGPTAEIAMLLILAAVRRAGPSFELLRRGEWQGVWAHAPAGAELNRKTLGIVGMGGVGTAVADRAAAFGMTVLYHNRNQLASPDEHGAQYVDSLDALLERSDVVTLHCPLTDHTRGMINADTLARMKPGAVLINTARGELLNESDVIAALESGHLGAAGLDVFAGEPNVNPYFLNSDNVFALPHIGTATPESRLAMEHHALDNLYRYFSGQSPRDLLVAPG